jgi:peptidoglycan/xylan/chitin deacetylase (PgdA/CDA1 family)
MSIKTLLFGLLTSFITLAVHAQEKKMCITIDDLPTVSYTTHNIELKRYITESIIKTCNDYDVPAIGYVNEHKLYRNEMLDKDELNLLESWLQNGLELGNHTYSHMSYHQSSFDEFAEDVKKGDVNLKKLAKKYNSEISYFRHPFLHSGSTKSSSDSLHNFLVSLNYTESPVTCDNQDYLFAKAYATAHQAQDSAKMKAIAEAYIQFTGDKLDYYESISYKLYDRYIDQIMLIHANQLNADYLDKLLELFQSRGYTFISQQKVLEDPVYQQEVTEFGNWGISWLEKWAMSMGKTGSFFKDEPEVPAIIK